MGVIECGLLSGLCLRRCQKPLAGMVIRGTGPNLFAGLDAQDPKLVFLLQIWSIILPMRVVAFSHLFTGTQLIAVA